MVEGAAVPRYVPRARVRRGAGRREQRTRRKRAERYQIWENSRETRRLSTHSAITSRGSRSRLLLRARARPAPRKPGCAHTSATRTAQTPELLCAVYFLSLSRGNSNCTDGFQIYKQWGPCEPAWIA